MKQKILVLALVLFPLALAAQTGTWGMRGISRDFVVVGDVVFAADGRGVTAYDSSGATIRRIDVETSEFETEEIAVAAGELFAATRGGVARYVASNAGDLESVGLIADAAGFTHVAADQQWVAASNGRLVRVWRRSGFNEPLKASQLLVSADADALELIGGRLYVAVRNVALYVFDPATGRQVGELPLAVSDLAPAGTVLWAAIGGNGIASIDVSNPDMPVLMATAQADYALDGIAVAGSRVYARATPNHIAVFDGSTPGAPRLVTTLAEPVTALAANSRSLFVAGSQVDRWGIATETGKPLRAFDPQTLALRAEFADLAGPVSGVATDGTLAWVVDAPFFRVLDVSTTSMPREIASIRVEGLQDRVRVKNGLAVVYGRGPVNLIDVTNPYAPRHIGTYESEGRPPSHAAIARDTIVEANEASGMHVVDYSNPRDPRLTASRMWHYADVATSDDVIYALVTDRTLFVGDISDRTQLIAAFTGAHDAVQLDIAPASSARPEFLVTRSSTGINVLTLADPLLPRLLRFVPIDDPGEMGTGESTAWFEQGGELWSLDLRSAADPVPTGMRLLAPMSIASAAGKVVIADRYSVRIYGPETAHPRPKSPARRRAVRP